MSDGLPDLGRAAIRWTTNGYTAHHLLPARLRNIHPTSEQTTFHWRPADARAAATVVTIGDDAQLITATLRYDGEPAALDAMLRAGASGATLEVLPDRDNPQELYPAELESQGAVIELAPDPDLWFARRFSVQLTLRRTDGGTFQGLTEGRLVSFRAGQALGDATFGRDSEAFQVSQHGILESVDADILRTSWREDPDGNLVPVVPLELARENVLTRSEEFDHADWVELHAAISDEGDYYRLTADSGGTGQRPSVYQAVEASITTEEPVSVFFDVREGNNRYVMVSLNGGTTSSLRRATYDFDTDTWDTGSEVERAVAEPIDGGWLRLKVEYSSASTTDAVRRPSLRLVDGASSQEFDNPDGDEYVDVKRAQAESDAPFATSYIKTEGSSVTRPVEILSLSAPPAGMTLVGYHSFFERGTAETSGARLFQMGSGTGNSRNFQTTRTGSGAYRAFVGNGSDGAQESVTAMPDIGDYVEHIPILEYAATEARVRLVQFIDGEEDGSTDWSDWIDASALITDGWESDDLFVNSRDGGSNAGAQELGTLQFFPGRLIRSALSGADSALYREVRKRAGA